MDRPTTGVNAVGSGGGNTGNDMYSNTNRPPLAKKGKFISLRVGEIVQGTILELISDTEVSVQLPVGTMNAVLNGKLKKGDQLFFRVTETSPSLILKIHAVANRVRGEELSSAELIRILDLPNNLFFSLFIEYIKPRRTLVNRDELLLFFKAFVSLSDTELKQEHSENIFKTLFMMKEAFIPLKADIYQKLKPFFIGEKDILANFKTIYDDLKELPNDVRIPLEDVFNKMRNPSTSFADLIKFFSLVSDTQNQITFYDILSNLVEHINKIAGQKLYRGESLKEAASNIMQAIEGQNIYNAYAQQGSSMMIFFIPILHSNVFRFAQILISKKGKTKDDRFILKFMINTDTNFIDLIEHGVDIDSIPGSTFSADNDKIKFFLEQHFAKIKDYLIKHDFIIDNLTVNNVGKGDFFSHNNSDDQKIPNLSVVI